MIFESIYIGSFGKLSDIKLDFSDGVNIIEGENESGKSTICGFIKFMFYGLGPKSEEKLRYISWQTACASGTLTFSDAGHRYRIEREVVCATASDGKNAFREKCAVYDAETNLPCFKGQSPGELFFGVSASVFDSTVYIRQSSETKIGGHELGEEAENILFSGNESINTKKAVAKLDGARVFLMHKNRRGGKIVDLENTRTQTEESLEIAKKASGDIIYLEGTHRQISEKKGESEQRLAVIREELETYERYTMKKAYMRRKNEKARLAETRDAIEALRQPPEHRGIDIAEESYINALEKKSSELDRASSRYSDAEEELAAANKKLSDMSGKLAIFERFNAAGDGQTRDELIEKTRTMHKTQNKFFSISRLLFVFGFFLIAVTLLLILTVPDLDNMLKLLFLVPVPVCFVAGLVLLSKSALLKQDVRSICTKFDCRNYAEFEELIKAASEDEAYMVFITGARDEAGDKFNAASERLEQISADILNTLGKDGFEISENTAASLSDAIAICRKTQTEIASLESAAAEQQNRILEIEETLSHYPKEYLRDACLAEYDEEAMEEFHQTAKRRDKEFLEKAIASQTERMHQIEVELSALLATSVKPTELAEQKAALDAKIDELRAKWDAYMLAIESLEAASGKLREGISPKIAKSAGKLMNLMTDGKYETLGVDMDFGLSFSDGTMMRDVASLSAGTGDMAYLCLRIALIELLYQKSVPPFLFDESFSRMDDARLSRVLNLISKYADRHYQSILFTCHSREKEQMSAVGPCRILSI